MEHDHRHQFGVELLGRGQVQLSPSQLIRKGIGKEGHVAVRLFEFRVDLPGDAVVAAQDRSSAFRDADAVEKRTGNVIEGERTRHTAQQRNRLDESRDINPAQAEQANGFGTQECVGVLHLCRGTAFERFSKRATR